MADVRWLLAFSVAGSPSSTLMRLSMTSRIFFLQKVRSSACLAAVAGLELVSLETKSVQRVGDRPLPLFPSGLPCSTSLSMLLCSDTCPKNLRILEDTIEDSLCLGLITLLLAVQCTLSILRQIHISKESILLLSLVLTTHVSEA